MQISFEVAKITMPSAGAPALVWVYPTTDIPSTLVTVTSSDHGVPSTAKGVIVGVEVGYALNPGVKACVQGNVQYVPSNGSTSYPYTDIIRVEQYFDPAAAVGAAMGQAWVPFTSTGNQIRYQLIGTTTGADKYILIQVHGWWE